jgi:uncharacterized Zn-finger protein
MMLQYVYLGELQFPFSDFNGLSDVFHLLGLGSGFISFQESTPVTNITITAFRCQHCNLTFNNQLEYLSHIALTHSGPKLFSCTLCPSSFDQRIALNAHMFVTHDNVGTAIPEIERFIRGMEDRSDRPPLE